MREKLQNIKAKTALLFKDKTTWVVLGTSVLIIAGGGAISYYSSAKNKKTAEDLISSAQAITQQNTSSETGQDHQDNSNAQFSDISDTKFNKPSCGRLENRTAIIITSGCDYKLIAHGTVDMAVVYLYSSTYTFYQKYYSALTNPDTNNQTSLSFINTYIGNQAKRYGVKDPVKITLKNFGPFKTDDSAVNMYYRSNGDKLFKMFSQTSSDNNVPEEDYDLVHYVLLDPVYGGMAFPWMHRAFTENDYGDIAVPTFIHETLHLFGASDKYNNNDCATKGTGDPFGRYNGTQPGVDIMCSNFSVNYSNINDITAREIGWAN